MSTYIYIYINIYQNNHLDVYRYFQIDLALLFFFFSIDFQMSSLPAVDGCGRVYSRMLMMIL